MKTMPQFVSKCAQILMVLVILVCLINLLQVITLETLKLFAPRETQTSSPYRPDPARRLIQLLPDGTAHQTHQTEEKDPNTDNRIVEVYDVNNTLITRSSNLWEPNSPYLSFSSRMGQSSIQRRLHSQYAITPGFSTTMDIPVTEGDVLQEIWRYDRNREILRGYDRTGKSLGCLGKEGLKQDSTTSMGLGRLGGFWSWWAPEKDRLKLLWLTQGSLYEIDVKTRRVDILADSNDSPISTVSEQAWYKMDKKDRAYRDPNVYRPLIVCRSNHAYHLALREPNQSITFSAPEQWRVWLSDHCRFLATKTDLFMLRSWTEFRPLPPISASRESHEAWSKEFRSTKKRHWTEVYRIDAQGGLEKLKTFSWVETQVRNDIQVTRLPWTSNRLVRCVSSGLYTKIPSIVGRRRLEAYYSTGRQASWPSLMSLLMVAPQGPWDYLIPSLILTVLAFGHGRSRWTCKRHAVFWLILVLLFNLVGFLTYLAFNHTAVIRCTHCAKRRGLAADACPRCGTPLPQPVHSRPHLILNRSQLT